MPDSPNKLRLLLVEDNESDAGLVLREYKRAGLITEHQRVQTADAMRSALSSNPWDAIICDFSLPGFGAVAALEEMHRAGKDLPFIIVSGTIPDQAALDLMRRGAHDYILKDNLFRLVPATRREINEAQGRMRRRQAELELEQSRAMYQSLVDTLPAAVFRKDTSGRFVFINSLFCEFFGCTPRDVLGRSEFDPTNPELSRRFEESDYMVVDTGQVQQCEEIVERPGSAPRTIEIVKGPVFDTAGAIAGVQGFFWDITERRKAEDAHRSVEAQLRQVQKMEAIGQLSGGVAHDFNNILTVIQCRAALMEADPTLPPKLKEAALEINDAAERGANLTRQLLAFSRRQDMRLANLNLSDVVDKVAWMLKRIVGENITVHLHYSATPAGVLADSTMIEQVLLNLVVNARDAMPEGGMVEIETHLCTVTEEAAKSVEDAKPGEYVCLSIRDTGSGMSPAVQARLFEPFFTTKDVGKGTGMGLSVVHGIVRQHQGWIEVETAPNRGSLFRIYIPYVALPAGQPADTPVVSTPIPVGSETILLVEDEPPLRNIMRTFLQDLGYQVIEAASGRSALTIWREQSANIQLLLTDMVMPGRLNGRELAERVHHDRPDLPVLYITGYSPETASGAISLKEGVNYIPKPFTPRRLGMAVRAVLDARPHPNAAVAV